MTKTTQTQEKKLDLSKYYQEEDLQILEHCIEANQPALLIGETGTGKTTLLKHLATQKKKNLVRLSMNGNMGTEEILGKFILENGKTSWQDGILTTAVRNGDWIVFDEINSASAEVLFALHALLDDERALVLPEKDNERVEAHKNFRFFASMNPEDYAGTRAMNQAFKSRFFILNVKHLPPDAEVELLSTKYKVKKDTAKKVVSIGTKLRELKKNEEITYFCSTRDLEMTCMVLENVKEPLNGGHVASAFTYAVFNKMPDMEVEVALAGETDITKYMIQNKDYIDNVMAKIENAKNDLRTVEKVLEDTQDKAEKARKQKEDALTNLMEVELRRDTLLEEVAKLELEEEEFEKRVTDEVRKRLTDLATK